MNRAADAQAGRRTPVTHLAPRIVALFLGLAAVLWTGLGFAFTPPPLHGHVVDTASTLSQDQVLRLDKKLDRARQQTGFAVVVFIVGSLDNEPIEDVAYTTFNTWKVGSAKGDDGVLLVIAPNEKKTRIETGKGVGGALTDVQTSHINREVINPLLKQGLYYEAVNRGTDRILAELAQNTEGGKSTAGMGKQRGPAQSGPVPALGGMLKIGIIAGVIVLVIILAIVSPTFREILFWVLLFGRFGGGGGGGGSGGGGGGSGYGGGGGSSGGGGSTDDW